MTKEQTLKTLTPAFKVFDTEHLLSALSDKTGWSESELHALANTYKSTFKAHATELWDTIEGEYEQLMPCGSEPSMWLQNGGKFEYSQNSDIIYGMAYDVSQLAKESESVYGKWFAGTEHLSSGEKLQTWLDIIESKVIRHIFDGERPEIGNAGRPTTKQEFTIEALTEYLQENGYTCRYNVLSHQLEVLSSEDTDLKKQLRNHITDIYSTIQSIYKNVRKDLIRDYIENIGINNEYNPVLSYLSTLPAYDKTEGDYLPIMCKAMYITDDLSKELLHKWLKQAYVMLHAEKSNLLSAETMIILHGRQGIGKSVWGKYISLQAFNMGTVGLFKAESNLKDDKDSLIQNTNTWITELSECEKTFKQISPENFKSIITQREDEYRKAYRADEETVSRKTVFYGSCNTDEVIQDYTGNRRFPFIECNVPRGCKFDFETLERITPRLWKQIESEIDIEHEIKAGGDTYRLSDGEQEAVSERAEQYREKSNIHLLIEDIFIYAEEHDTVWDYMSTVEFLRHHGINPEKNASKAGRILQSMGLAYKVVHGTRKYKLPKHTPYVREDGTEIDEGGEIIRIKAKQTE